MTLKMLCQVVQVLKVSWKIFAVYIVVIYFKKLISCNSGIAEVLNLFYGNDYHISIVPKPTKPFSHFASQLSCELLLNNC